MAAPPNPGAMNNWRYDQAPPAANPKSGNTGTMAFWRYDQAPGVYVANAGQTWRFIGLPLRIGL